MPGAYSTLPGVTTSTGKTAQELLDEVVRPAQLDGFAVEGYHARLAEEIEGADEVTLDGLEARDTRLRGALAAIDGFAGRSMRIRLDHLLALDTAIPPTFRTYLAGMVTSYEHDRDTLRARVATVVARSDPGRAAELADAVAAAAGEVLALRARLRDGVLALERSLAARTLPIARQAARDPYASDEVRARWTAIADRLKAVAAVDEPPDEEEAQPSREELIELE
jgi:hypothetical protein